MPVLESSSYRPPVWLRNGHINTIYPYYFRKKNLLLYIRERFSTPDNDFYDVDWLLSENKKRLCILLHGLEGSSGSQYIRGNAKTLYNHEFNIAAINFRSCSGEINRQPTMYHSGFTKDLHHFVQNVEAKFDEIFLCGFSLGGNVVMKYAGDGVYSLSPKIKAIAGVSVPCDLRAGSIKIMERKNHFYETKFLETLLKKVKIKHQHHPDKIDIRWLNKVKTLWDFDDRFTSTLHGFQDAEDYYRQCNSKQFLSHIKIPALIINAKDDTFLPESSYPYDEAKSNENLFLMTPKYGGHVGFTTFGTDSYWNETNVLKFFMQYSAI